MKRINIENFLVLVNGENVPYEIKTSIQAILFNPQLKLDGIKLIKHFDIWNKIKKQEKELILEDADYEILKSCVNFFQGYSQNDVEFVKRIQDAKNYEIKKEIIEEEIMKK